MAFSIGDSIHIGKCNTYYTFSSERKIGIVINNFMYQDNELVHTINRHLFAMLGSTELVYKWWESPNKYWEGNTPASVFEIGEQGQHEVYNYIMWHSYGSGG